MIFRKILQIIPVKVKVPMNVQILLCSAVGLFVCWGLSQPCTFSYWKDRMEEELVCFQTFSKA